VHTSEKLRYSQDKEAYMKDLHAHKYKGVVRGFLHQLLQVDVIRFLIAAIRYWLFVKVLRRLKTFELNDDKVAGNTISHNLKGMSDLAVVRSLALVKPVTAIDRVGVNSRVLAVGPRTEGELFSLVGYGFLPKNIRGLDLISYSSWIDLGDMHQMPYAENSFDVVIMGWVLAYSEDPASAAREIVRVASPGAVVAVGIEYGGKPAMEQIQKLGYTPGAGRVTESTAPVKEWFGDAIEHVYFDHSIETDRKEEKGSVILVFSIRK